MEFKGTKEKWEVGKEYDHAYSQQLLNISNEIDGCMATIWTGKERDEEIWEETTANALLISKAPEMLEMLNRINEDKLWGTDQDFTELKQLIKEATEL